MKSVALIILFNHRFDRNIETIERIYTNRFSNIFHLVPFYDGDKPNVIPVYEHSHYFQGYIAQGFKSFYREDFEHYLFVADDMILNPVIDENNYKLFFNLKENTAFIPELLSFHTVKEFWPRIKQAFQYRLKIWGVEAEKELPSYDEALERFKKFGLEIKPLKFEQIYNTFKPTPLKSSVKWLLLRIKHSRRSFKLKYPLVGAYSDILVVPRKSIKKFCHYSGVFAATKLFVEVAIPTAVVLTSDEIQLEKNLSLHGKALWTDQELKELDAYKYNLKSLLKNFPENYLYLHPVKLSKWNSEGV